MYIYYKYYWYFLIYIYVSTNSTINNISANIINIPISTTSIINTIRAQVQSENAENPKDFNGSGLAYIAIWASE